MIEALLENLSVEISQTDALALLRLYPRQPLNSAAPGLNLLRLVAQDSDVERVSLQGGFLLHERWASPASLRAVLTRPADALRWVRPLQQAQILYDPQGLYAQLQAEARSFVWQPFQASADASASAMLRTQAFNVQRLLNALARDELFRAQDAMLALWQGLAQGMLVQRGILLDRYDDAAFIVMQDPAHSSPAWAAHLASAAALGDAPGTPLARAAAALHLYYESASLLRHVCSHEDFQFVLRVLRLIQESPYFEESEAES